MYKTNKDDLRELQRKYVNETKVKNSVIERLESTRQQMKALELNNGSVASIWKEKCKELADICNELKSENDYLNNKTQQLAEVSVNLLSTLNEYHRVQAQLARLSEAPPLKRSTQGSDAAFRSQSTSKHQALTRASKNSYDSKSAMSLPKVQAGSNPGIQQQEGGPGHDDPVMKRARHRPLQSSVQMVSASNFPAPHELETRNRHLIFKSPEANAQKPQRKRGGHNRGRSLLEIQRDHERESRIGKL